MFDAKRAGAEAGRLDGRENRRNGGKPSTAPDAYREEALEAANMNAYVMRGSNVQRDEYIAAYRAAFHAALTA
jgi:hypothetical protein